MSARASADLCWTAAARATFQRYEVQRDDGGGFLTLATVTTWEDTVFTDSGLRANHVYRYQVRTWSGHDSGSQALTSPVVTGGLHRLIKAWSTGSEASRFIPTRLVVDSRGTVSVVGSGGGRLLRYDAAGTPQGEIIYAQQSLACLAAGALDGPALAVDSHDDVYVIYNILRDGGTPEALWSKFTAAGSLVWTRPLDGLFARHITIDEEDRIFIESISRLQRFDDQGKRLESHSVPAMLVASLRVWQGSLAALIEPLSLTDSDWQAPRLVVYEDPQRRSPQRVIGRDPASLQDMGDGLLRRPTDFAVAADGQRVFVVNAGAQRIEVFSGERYLTRWGGAGRDPGQFRFAGEARVIEDIATGTVVVRNVLAGGIACDGDGYVYVADAFNDRIQKFAP